MWVIFFQDAPHFWLVGGEAYRVGTKDCHVVIRDDRSISRTHLTISVALPPSNSGVADGRRDKSTPSTPQPITLTDSSTYGTSVAAAGEEVEDGETQDSNVAHGTTAALDVGIVGLRYAPSAVVRGRSGSASNRSGSGKRSATQPALQLTKGVPFNVPVYRAPWRQITIQLGHHGAALRLVWVDVSVLCEDVDVEVQTKLEHALRFCGVRQEIGPAAPSSSPSDTAETSPAMQQHRRLNRNTLSEGSAPGVEGAPVGAGALPAVLGGSGVLSLSQRTSVPATPPVPVPPLADSVSAAQTWPLAMATVSGACYNHVDFLVTSTVQPSTAVVGMLCRAVPIVSPAFFTAIRDRVSPQLPLPDPRLFTPPLSAWWRSFIERARQAAPTVMEASAVHSASHTEDTSVTASPYSSSVTYGSHAAPATAAADATSPQAQLSEYFAPNPQRCELFRGVAFVVVQRALYEEVMHYLDCTGATVVWEGVVGDWATPAADDSETPFFSPKGFQALQSFFVRHQRHVLLYSETEGEPFTHCLTVLQQALGLCSVEYGVLIESVVFARAPPLTDYPDNARLPQTVEEVQARVRLARGELTSERDSCTQDSEWDAAPQGDDADMDEAIKGRRTDAQPLFPDVATDMVGSPSAQRKGSRGGGDGLSHSVAHTHKRPRREDAEGWVTLGRAAAAVAVPATTSEQKEGVVGTARTVDIHCSPYALPPYPCFAGAKTTTTVSATSAEQRKVFVKQVLPPAEPLVELEEHHARRQLAASMLVARVPTVDADTIVLDQVVMGGSSSNGGGGYVLQNRAAAFANAAFNTFDTAVHHASSKRRGTAARRGRGGGASGSGRTRPTPQTIATVSSSTTGASAVGAAAVVDVDDVDDVEAVGAVGPLGVTAGSAFHIFDIDGIF
ncbi:hypothetical protein ABL78_3284 [Leptomonas seymouri]|uniref:FHA domain-containing protein n=1 Tax=Leptomonas seymouri TaxID=5684 RepID=A0A0N0P6V8_LEPSE|nr:hypothetical protein ABL78_3284 [Leptomonas seymouri]|eukprot:KPI87627.1 hypothetical protein ABL78_3284 [Leptomonas seymouri]